MQFLEMSVDLGFVFCDFCLLTTAYLLMYLFVLVWFFLDFVSYG